MTSQTSTPRTAASRIDATVREMRPHAAKAAALLKALANEQRLMIVCNLVAGPLSVGELNDRVQLSQSALSQHLSVLREVGIVSTTREAQSITYSLPSGIATRIIRLLNDEFCPAPRRASERRE